MVTVLCLLLVLLAADLCVAALLLLLVWYQYRLVQRSGDPPAADGGTVQRQLGCLITGCLGAAALLAMLAWRLGFGGQSESTAS
jgi:hypothetical protein